MHIHRAYVLHMFYKSLHQPSIRRTGPMSIYCLILCTWSKVIYHKIHVGPMHIHPLPYTVDHTQLVGLALSTTAMSTRYGAVVSFAGNAAVMHNDNFPQSRSLQ